MYTPKNNVLIIAGMHRSGTSLVSHWLHRCGLNLGETLLGADIGNVEGHFEDVDFYRFHEDTLAAHHLSKFGFTGEPVKALSEYEEEKLKSIINLKNKLNRQWGWKDPRTCLFLANYRQLIPDARYLNIVRDYGATINSMIIRDFKHHEKKYLKRKWLSRAAWKIFRRQKQLDNFYRDLAPLYLNVWIAYNGELLKNAKLVPADQYLFIDHRQLIDDDKTVFGHLTDNWHFDLQYYDFKKIFKESLISPVTDIDHLIDDKGLLKKAKSLEIKLKELCIEKRNLQKELP
jgi:hypothetical protein